MDFERYVTEIERARTGARSARGGRGAAGLGAGFGSGAGEGEPANLVVLSRTVSTNLLARGVAADFESEGLDLSPMLVLALEQSGGRGREGRSWSSPRGQGVYATLARRYEKPDLLPGLPLLVGVGLCRALAPHVPRGCRLKWPNDLVVPAASPPGNDGDEGDDREGGEAGTAGADAPRGRKIGGVLIEALVHPGDGCVALIGFGVNHGHHAEQLPAGATSLLLETGGHLGGGGGIGLAELTWELVTGVERELAHLEDLAYAVAAYRELIVHRLGDRLACRLGDRRIEGTFAGIDDRGRLRLRRLPAPEPAAGAPGAGQEQEGEETVLSAGEVIER